MNRRVVLIIRNLGLQKRETVPTGRASQKPPSQTLVDSHQ